MTEPSRSERYLKALEIAERNCNRFMAAKIRADRLPPPDQQMEPHHHYKGEQLMTDHPITPPPELVQEWQTEVPYQDDYAGREHWLIDRAAQWGADRELEACCDWLREAKNHGFRYDIGAKLALKLRATRRPKPPSLREEALAKTTALLDDPDRALLIEVREILELNRRALEALSDD